MSAVLYLNVKSPIGVLWTNIGELTTRLCPCIGELDEGGCQNPHYAPSVARERGVVGHLIDKRITTLNFRIIRPKFYAPFLQLLDYNNYSTPPASWIPAVLYPTFDFRNIRDHWHPAAVLERSVYYVILAAAANPVNYVCGLGIVHCALCRCN